MLYLQHRLGAGKQARSPCRKSNKPKIKAEKHSQKVTDTVCIYRAKLLEGVLFLPGKNIVTKLCDMVAFISLWTAVGNTT